MNESDGLQALYRVASIRALEARLQAGLPPAALMARAAAAVAEAAAQRLRSLPGRAEVALLVGPGNNGGDALLAGLELLARGYRVRAWGVDAILGTAPRASDAAIAWQRWQPRPIEPLAALLALAEDPAAAAATGDGQSAPLRLVLIDGLFGIGLTRPPDAGFAPLFAALQRLRAGGNPIIAIDVPSGLDADTGALPATIAGAATAPLAVDITVTMIGDKPGLHTGLGSEVAGRVVVASLRPEASDGTKTTTNNNDDNATNTTVADDAEPAPDGYRITAEAARRWLPARRIDSHKGRHGDLLIIGGREGMQGAARLAARGALGAGIGKVSIAVSSPAAAATQPADPARPEVMSWPWQARELGRFDAVAAGCGLGFTPIARRWLAAALSLACPLILDADALTWIATDHELRRRLRARPEGRTVLTPHPLEAGRLLERSVAIIQHDRLGAALALARRTGAIVVLKGSGTVIADAAEHWAINGSGGPVLATAGTGDVLTGIIAALACQMPLAQAACLGTWAHGAAGDAQAAASGAIGTPAGHFAERLPEVWSALHNGKVAAASAAP